MSRPIHGGGWNDERVELLTKLWHEGVSCTGIAKQIGGITRNAVIGKVRRLKLSGRETAYKPGAPKSTTTRPKSQGQGRQRPIYVPRTAHIAAKAPGEPGPRPPRKNAFEALAGSTPVPMGDRPKACIWPIDGEDGELLACGLPRADLRYCAEHKRIGAGDGTPSEQRAAS